jgi:hypothetical protein
MKQRISLEFVKNLGECPTSSVQGTLSFGFTLKMAWFSKKRRDDGKTAEKVKGVFMQNVPRKWF